MSSYLEHDGWYDDNGTWIEEAPDTGKEIPLPEEPDWFQDGPPVNREHDGYYDDNGTWIEESPRVENYIKNSETTEIDLDRFSDLSGRIRPEGETRNAAASGPADDCLPSLRLNLLSQQKAKHENKSPYLPLNDAAAEASKNPNDREVQTGGGEKPPTVEASELPPPMNDHAQNFRAEYSTDPLGMMGAYGEVLARAGYQIEAQRDDFIEGKGRDFFSFAIHTIFRPQTQTKGRPFAARLDHSNRQIVYGMDVLVPLILQSDTFLRAFDGVWLKHHAELVRTGILKTDTLLPWPKFVSMLLTKLARVFMDPHPQGGWMLARVGTSQEFWYPNHHKLAWYFKDRARRGWKFPWDMQKIESKTEYRQEWGAQITWSEYTLFKNRGASWETIWNTIRDIRAAKRLRGG